MQKKTSAIVLAAGQGKRMKSNVQKQYLLIHDKPVLYYALKAFEDSEIVDEIILVTGVDEVEYCKNVFLKEYGITKITHIVPGGKERYHSVYEGLKYVKGEYVFIHDGARPFLTEDMIKRSYENVLCDKACVLAVPVKDTIKVADDSMYVKETPSRKLLWAIQTPQTFQYKLVKNAYEKLVQNEEELSLRGVEITDDSMVVENFTDVKVKLVLGDYENLKITTPEDLEIAESFLKKQF